MGVCTNILNILSDNKFEEAIMEHKPELTETRISADRIKHMHGVAELMYKYYDAFDCKYLSREECYVLGLLHDIGYIDGKENHEHRGCEILERYLSFGYGSVLVKCIDAHGCTPNEYKSIYGVADDEIMGELILLWWADMLVESSGEKAGEVVGFQGRLNGLEERYGSDSLPYRICKETIDWLVNKMSLDFLCGGDV